jgi:hypothetical protein
LMVVDKRRVIWASAVSGDGWCVDLTRASSRYYTCKILGHQRSSSIVLQ